MKIGIVVRILWPAGTQFIAIKEARELKSLGHDVTLFFLRGTERGKVYDELLRDVNYKVLTWKNTSRFVKLYDLITGVFLESRKGEGRVDYNLIHDFHKTISGQNFELLICHDQWAGVAGFYSHKKLGIKYVVYIHERINDYPSMEGLGKRILVYFVLRYQYKILRNAKNVYGVTDKVSDSVLHLYNIKCSPDVPGLEQYPFVQFKDKENIITFLSFWSDVKHPEKYLTLLSNISNFKFWFLGTWSSQSYKETFLKKAEVLKISQNIEIFEQISQQEKINLLKKSKFFIRFGWDEYGVATGVLEALECGLPIICNGELGISNDILSNKLGLVINNLDGNELNKFLEEKNDENQYLEIQNNINNYLMEHSWQKHVEILIK
jgi:glycosyltransferase involved in cell wall biosynthesis